MNKIEYVNISDTCTLNPKKSEIKLLDPNTDVSFVPMAAVSEEGLLNYSEIKPLQKVYKSFTYFRENDILFAKITPCMENGKGCLATGLTNGIGFGSTEFHVLRPKDNVSAKYIHFLLRSKIFRKQAELKMTGSAGQKRVPTDFFKKAKIPLPPLPVQKKIADILDAADALRQKDKALISKYTELAQALFLEMFGDPVVNPMGWELINLEKASLLMKDGPFGSNLKSQHYTTDGVRVIRLQNIGVNQFIDSDKAFISISHYETIKKHTCSSGDVLVATLGSPNIRACKFPSHLNIAINKADCVQIKPNPKIIINDYLVNILNLPSALYWVGNMLHGQTRTRVSMGQLKTINIPKPPITRQNQFAKRIEAIEQQKHQAELSLEKSEALFGSLMQKAFKGELVS